MIVYKIQNKVNGKIYVGCTGQPLRNRFVQHLGSKAMTEFHTDLKEYGKDAFIVEEIAQVDDMEEAFELESMCMGVLDCVKPNGYNIKVAAYYYKRRREVNK